MLDLNTWTWAQLAASGDAPTPRRGHAAEPLGDRFWLLHGGYDGEQQLGDARLLDVTTGSWSRLAVAGGPEEWPVPRALHTLTHVGHMLVLLGGATPLGPAGDVHLLVNGALLQGMVQNQRVLSTVQRLAGSEARAARLAAEAATAKSSEEKALQQVAALKQRAAHVVSSYNSAVADVEALKDALQREHREAAAANSAARAATQKAATLARRLARAKEGGGEVAAAARELWEQLQQAELQQAQLQRQLQLRVHVGVELADARAQNQALEAQLEQVEAHYLRQLQERDERIAKLEQQQQAAPAATPGPSSPDRGGAAAPSASPSRRTTATPLFSRPGSSAEVAVQYARAEAAERQFIGLQDDVCKLQARVAQLQVEAERERRSAQGSEQTAQAAVAQLRELESGYQQQLEAVAQQLAASRQQCYRLEAELAARAATAAAAAVPVDVPSAALAGPRQQPAISTAAAAAAPQVSAGSPNRAPAATAGGVVSLTTIDGLDYAAPDFTVTYQQQQQQQQTAEGLQVGGERSTLEVLPEVAKLLQLHRTLIGEQP